MIEFQEKRLPRLAKFYCKNEIICLLCSEEIYNFVVNFKIYPHKVNEQMCSFHA